MKVAILYQAEAAPTVNGLKKPMKKGGYSDSGADIGYELKSNGISVIIPVNSPEIRKDTDWCFPDSVTGIERALALGANTFWLNTVLYSSHPIVRFQNRSLQFIGQHPETVALYDHKLRTNNLLSDAGLPVPFYHIIDESSLSIQKVQKITYPSVIKPILGRGSQGVKVIGDSQELIQVARQMFQSKLFGNQLYLEHYLEGQEITITVFPPGMYQVGNQLVRRNDYWALPPVIRENHQYGIAPYNGVVAVVKNSRAMPSIEVQNKEVQFILAQCQEAAKILQTKAPIRIDCRADQDGIYQIFDVNLKPNMTGASRPHRADQDSLTMIAAKELGWTYFDLLNNMLRTRWRLN